MAANVVACADTVSENGAVIATTPEGPVSTPDTVASLAAGRPAQAVWRNELGGLTFQLGTGPAREFVKWNPRGNGIDLTHEIQRLAWAAKYTTVPRVLAQGSDTEGSWFLSAGLPGESAVSDIWKQDPGTAVRAIGAGLRSLHEALPIDDCPFSWSAELRISQAHRRAAAGLLRPEDWHDDLAHVGDVDRALSLLSKIPPVDKLVVCHGDACAPNTLVDADGSCSGHVDLDALGVADRWADLAITTWSTEWNYGPGWEEPLLEAYGIAPDPERIAYYRLLWDLSD